MLFKIRVHLLDLSKKMWPRVTAYAVFAVVTALMANAIKWYIPESVTYKVDESTIRTILNILASSMLAVTTFSLTTMLSAFSSASTGVTPRATQLVVQDSTAQQALSTFLGSFLFSLAGIIALDMGYYDGGARLVLFVTSLMVVMLIVITLIRWIEHLTKLGRVSDTSRLVEQTAIRSLKSRAERPHFGCNILETVPEHIVNAGAAFTMDTVGYVRYVDVDALAAMSEKHRRNMFVLALPGTFLSAGKPILRVQGEITLEMERLLRACFIVGDLRSFEQDPRFGLCVLAEIASRALPPTANDLGTAIDVIGRIERVISLYRPASQETVKYKRIWIPTLSIPDLFEDAFGPIIHDAKESYEVYVRLLKTLQDLSDIQDKDFRTCASLFASKALRKADMASLLREEKIYLRQLADPIMARGTFSS